MAGGGAPGGLAPFLLERVFAKYEFSAEHLLCLSDCEPLAMAELLALAGPEERQLWENLSLAYTESQGLPALRREISSKYDTVRPEEVLVAVPEEGIYITMRALLRPGDTVVVTFPGYQSLYAVAEAIGCRVLPWRPRENARGELYFDAAEALALMEEHDPKLTVVNFPHNPTGKTLARADWDALVGNCRARGRHLFSDEMYRLLEHDEAARLPSAVDCYEKAITLCGVSKTMGLPGLRVGWVATHDASLYADLCLHKDYTTICGSAPSEILALIGLRAQERLVAANMATIRENLGLCRALVAEFPDLLQWDPPAAGSIAFPRLTAEGDVEDLCARLVEEHSVLLLPGSVYGDAAARAQGRFRLGLGRRGIGAGLDLLRRFLRGLRPAGPGPPAP